MEKLFIIIDGAGGSCNNQILSTAATEVSMSKGTKPMSKHPKQLYLRSLLPLLSSVRICFLVDNLF